MSAYRVLDIETSPDHSLWQPKPALERSPRSILRLDARPQRKGAESEEYTLFGISCSDEEPFAPPHAQRLVAIATVDLSDEDGRFYHLDNFRVSCAWSDETNHECDIETNLLNDFRTLQESDNALLVTWNGRTFDLPVLNMRSLHRGVPAKWYYEERDVRYRYTEAGHCDLMDVFSDYGAARNMKLDEVARAIGLPGKVGPFSGADIGKMTAGPSNPPLAAKIATYCLTDALQTAVLFIRSRFHKGMISKEECNAALRSITDSEKLREFPFPKEFAITGKVFIQ